MERRSFRAMGVQMLAVLDANASRSQQPLRQAESWFREWERRLSRFRPESELSQLNHRRGRSARISHMLGEALLAALKAERVSAGLVTPAVLGAVEAAGYDRSFEQIAGRSSSQKALTPATTRASGAAIRLNLARRRVVLAPKTRLDLGGVAKGWAADTAARRLGRYAPALVDAGGDIAVSGPMRNGDPWPIGIADPIGPGEQLALVMLRSGGIATSGRDIRRWVHNGQAMHHIIDPRSGLPAATDVLTATVIAPSAQIAEIGAKVALILGSSAGMAWIEQRPELTALLILESGQVCMSERMGRYLYAGY